MKKTAILLLSFLSGITVANAQSGNVGIGTITPKARLHVADSSVAFTAVGDTSATPGNPPIAGPGRRMMWYADKAAFRAGYTSGTGWDAANVGSYSFAAGNNAIASGSRSVAIGSSVFAGGNGGVAIGTASGGSGNYSTAIGVANATSGNYATAIGVGANASGDYSTALGNSVSTNNHPGTFIIGDNSAGTVTSALGDNQMMMRFAGGYRFIADSNLSRGMVIAPSTGNVGIGTFLPVARLHVADSSVLFSADGVVPSTAGPPPVEGPGRRMMWYPGKGAFRAGYATLDRWDGVNTGNYSAALGGGTIASGDYSFATGTGSTASGNSSTALGYNTAASSDASTALGAFTTASGAYSTAMGWNSIASGQFSVAIGSRANAGNHVGSFVFADNSQVNSTDELPGTNDNQMTMRFSGGYNFYANPALNTGLFIAPISGKVGIGTSSPAQQLHVSSAGPTTTVIEGSSTSTNTATNNVALSLKTPGNNFMLAALAWPGASYGFTIYDALHNADRLVISGTGNVGIGTTAPTAQLHTTGPVRFQGFGGGLVQLDTFGNVSVIPASSYVPANNNYVTTNTPQTISALKTFTNGKIRMMGSGDTLSSWGNLTIRANDDNSGNEALSFMVANTERARFDYNGNLGIGTASPTAQLHTTGSIRFQGLGTGYLVTDANGNLYATSGSGFIQNQAAANQAGTFRISGNGLFNGGQVGIGTATPASGISLDVTGKTHIGGYLGLGQYNTSPGYPLDIEGDNATRTLASLNGASSNGTWMRFENTTASSVDWNLYVTGSGNTPQGGAGKLIFRENAIGYDVITMTADSKVGINSTSPEQVLDVHGDVSGNWVANFSNTSNTASSHGIEIQAGQNSFSGSNGADFITFRRPDGHVIGGFDQATSNSVIFTTSSDIRLKEHIRTSQYSLADLLKIQVRDYNYIGDSAMQTGYLAQQLYTIFPNAVKVGGEDPKTDPWMVDYGRLTPLLVKSVQDLNDKVDALAKENNELKIRLALADQQAAAIATLAAQVKELQQTAGIKPGIGGAKTAAR